MNCLWTKISCSESWDHGLFSARLCLCQAIDPQTSETSKRTVTAKPWGWQVGHHAICLFFQQPLYVNWNNKPNTKMTGGTVSTKEPFGLRQQICTKSNILTSSRSPVARLDTVKSKDAKQHLLRAQHSARRPGCDDLQAASSHVFSVCMSWSRAYQCWDHERSCLFMCMEMAQNRSTASNLFYGTANNESCFTDSWQHCSAVLEG